MLINNFLELSKFPVKTIGSLDKDIEKYFQYHSKVLSDQKKFGLQGALKPNNRACKKISKQFSISGGK